jgi:hypothetical protein
MAERSINVKILGDARGFGAAATEADGHAGRLGKTLDGIGDFAKKGLGVAALGVGGLAAGLVSLAPSLLQAGVSLDAMNKKANTVFEDSRVEVSKWAIANAKSMGLTKSEATDLASSFGDLMKPMGFTAKQAAGMATDTLNLAGALSAWTGGQKSAADVSTIITKAMLGERDGLKELGISITEADLSARLLANGQDKLTGSALEQAKALATQQLILEKSTDAQKAWADGSMDGVKNMNNMKGSIKQLTESFTGALFPVLSGFVAMLAKYVLPVVDKITKALGNEGLGAAFGLIGDGIAGALPVIRTKIAELAPVLWGWIQEAGPKLLHGVGEMFAALGAWIWNTGIPVLGAAIAQMAVGFWGWIAPMIGPALAQLGEWLAALGGWIWNTALPWLGSSLLSLAGAFWGWIKEATPPALIQLGEWLLALGGWIIGTAMPAAIGWLANMGAKFISWIADVAAATPGKLADVLGALVSWLVGSALPWLAETAIKMNIAFWKFAAHVIASAPGELASAIGAITDWLGNTGVSALKKVGSLLGDALTAPFRVAFDGIRGLWNSTIGGFSFTVPDWIPGVGGKGFTVPRMHTGGIVPGAPGSEQLTILQAGERVLTVGQQRQGIASSPGATVINIYASSARDVFTALDEWTRYNGTLPARMVG